MSKTVLILFAACVGLSLLSLHLVRQMRAGQDTIAGLQAQVAKLEEQQQQALQRELSPDPPSAPISTLQPEPAAPPTAPAKEVAKAAAVARPLAPAGSVEPLFAPHSREERIRLMREARERQRQLMEDPEYREALRVQHRSNMSRQYPGLAEELGLNQEQTEKLFNLFADQQMRSNEMLEPMWGMEGDPAAAQQRQEKMQQQWAELQRKNESELATQLGAEKMQAWKEYQSTLGARHQADQLRGTLASQGVPLNEDANRAVVKALAEAQKLEMQEYANQSRVVGITAKTSGALSTGIGPRPEMFERQLEMTKKRNQRVQDALSPYLTYEQLEAVRREHESQLKIQEAQLRIMRAQSNNGANANDWTYVGGNSVQAVIVPAEPR